MTPTKANMTPESVPAMIDQALLRKSTNGDGTATVRPLGITEGYVQNCAPLVVPIENQVSLPPATLLGASFELGWNGQDGSYRGTLVRGICNDLGDSTQEKMTGQYCTSGRKSRSRD
ncbi:hypothetical protein Tco_0672203 [Tanacetum coccineum]